MDFDPQKIYDKVIEAGDMWADRKAAYEALDDNTKSVLADLTSMFLANSKSKAEAEMYALASPEFKAHLHLLQQARRGWLLAQVRYDSLKMLAELRRTQESTRRAEMKL